MPKQKQIQLEASKYHIVTEPPNDSKVSQLPTNQTHLEGKGEVTVVGFSWEGGGRGGLNEQQSYHAEELWTYQLKISG